MAVEPATEFEFGEEGQASGIVGDPAGVGVDQSSGNVYIGDGFQHSVNKFEANGTPLFAWGWGILNGAEEEQTCTTSCNPGYSEPFGPHAVFGAKLDQAEAAAVDPTGEHDVYVLDTGYSRIEKFKPNGEFLFSFGGDTVAYGPDNSTNDEVQKLKVKATGGHYELHLEYAYARAYEGGVGGSETGEIQATAGAAEIESELNKLHTVNDEEVGGEGVEGGKVNVKETATREFELTFEGNLAGDIVPAIRPEYSCGEFCSTLTGGEEKAEVEVVHPGGEAEVCKPSNGDTCKDGGVGTGNGQFMAGSHYEGHFYSAFPSAFPNAAAIIAVGSTGTVYVGDNERVQEFSPEGKYTGQINIPTASGHWNFTRAVAVDGSGDVFAINEAIDKQEELEHPGSYKREVKVREFGPSGNLLRTLEPAPKAPTPVEPTTLAVDKNGDVFVGEDVNNPGEPTYTYEFAAYKPDGSHYAQFAPPLVRSSCHEYNIVYGTAIGNTANDLYVTNQAFCGIVAHHVVAVNLAAVAEPGLPTVEEEKVSNIEPNTATLHAVINPKGYDTHYHFEYGATATYDHSTASTDLGLVIEKDQVQGPLSRLKPATLYHYRAVAESECEPTNPGHMCVVDGPDETFETVPPVTVRNFTTQTVGPELVTFRAELNPNGESSIIKVRYGTGENYACEPEHECEKAESLPPGNEFVKMTEGEEKEGITFKGLKPNTTYHYQLFAENGYGEYKTQDATFTTERSDAEEAAREHCPNKIRREENSSLHLPDCRAYELVNPDEMNGGQAFAYVGLSPNGERALFYSEGAFAGATGNQLFIPYVAQRTESGWKTQAMVRRPLPPPIEPTLSGLNFAPEMDRWLYYESQGLNIEESAYEQSSVFMSMGLIDGSTIVHATPTIGLVEGSPTEVYVFAGVAAASNDLSRLYIVTSRKDLSSDPRPDENFGGGSGHGSRVYEVAGVGGPSPTMRLVAEVPLGLSASSGFGEAGCEINNENALELQEPRITSTDGSIFFYAGPIEKEAGKGCGEGTPNPIGIFAHVGETTTQLNVAPPSQCTSGHPCATAAPTLPHYLGASEDGSLVWFATEQPLVNSDTDVRTEAMTGKDIYVAKVNPATGQLKEIVQASAGVATATHPHPGEGADVGETGVRQESGAKQTGASVISADGSHGAFESPAVLTEEKNGLGQSAVQGANNLYVYDVNTSKLKFVAELCSGPEMSGSEYSRFTVNHNHKLEIGTTAVRDTACPTTLSPWMQTIFATGESDDGLWLEWGGRGLERMTPDGRYLLFESFGRLTPDDTANNKLQLFRYDFETGQLIRISVGHNGNDGNFNDPRYSVAQFNENGGFSGNKLAENGGRSISADGSTIVFQTEAPLVSRDTNLGKHPECSPEGNGCDVYEWEEDGHGTCEESPGCVSLISDGKAEHGSEHGVIGLSGKDIVFGTQDALTSGDTNGGGNIWDAHVNGGFHRPEEPPICTTSESCLHAAGQPPGDATRATETFNGPPNNAILQRPCAKGKVRVIKHGEVRCVRKRPNHNRRHHRRRRHRRAANTGLGGGK